MILIVYTARDDVIGNRGHVQDPREIQLLGLPMVNRLAHVELVAAANHFVNGLEAQLSHQFANLLSNHAEVVDDVFGFACEFLPEDGILRRYADRARIEMADAHHNASRNDQRRSRESKLLRAEQRRNDDIAAGLQLAVGLDDDAASEIVQDQNLMRLRQTQLPWDAGMFNAGEGRSARSTAVARYQDDVGMCLGNACCDRSDPPFCDQLYAYASAGVRIFQIVNQLGQILDRIDVVMRRR